MHTEDLQRSAGSARPFSTSGLRVYGAYAPAAIASVGNRVRTVAHRCTNTADGYQSGSGAGLLRKSGGM